MYSYLSKNQQADSDDQVSTHSDMENDDEENQTVN